MDTTLCVSRTDPEYGTLVIRSVTIPGRNPEGGQGGVYWESVNYRSFPKRRSWTTGSRWGLERSRHVVIGICQHDGVP